MIFDNWVRQAAVYSAGTGQVDLPQDWHRMDSDELASVLCPQIAQLQILADSGDREAAQFFQGLGARFRPLTGTRRNRGVGLVTTSARFPGGLETWLMQMLAIPGIRYSGVAVETESPDDVSPRLIEAAIRAGVHVVAGRGAADSLAARSDKLVASLSPRISIDSGFAGPVVFVSHGACHLTRWCQKAVRPAITHLVAVSEAAIEPLDVSVGRPTVIHNGVDVDAFANVPTRRESSTKIVGYLGRFSDEKRPLDAAEACQLLHDRFVPWLVGVRPDETTWRKNARVVCDRVIVSEAKLSTEAMANMDCLVTTGDREGFNLTLVEAWAAGLPTIAQRTGIVPEALIACDTSPCFVWDGRSHQELASLVKRAVGPEGQERAAVAKAYCQANFTLKRFGDRWRAYLESLAETSS